MPHLERDVLKCLLYYTEVLSFLLSFNSEVRNKELSSVSGFMACSFRCMMGSSVTLTHSADKSELFLDVCTVYKDFNAWLSVLIFWTLHFAQVNYNHTSKLYLL